MNPRNRVKPANQIQAFRKHWSDQSERKLKQTSPQEKHFLLMKENLQSAYCSLYFGNKNSVLQNMCHALIGDCTKPEKLKLANRAQN